jgi:8-oxo-dGTP diphosphatase
MPIDVVCGIVINAKRQILIGRRREGKSQAGYWEFPGGKVENETAEEALRRELREELLLEIGETRFFMEALHQYPNAEINLICFTAKHISGPMRASDHDLVEWVNPEEISSFPFSDADIPIVKAFLEKEK